MREREANRGKNGLNTGSAEGQSKNSKDISQETPKGKVETEEQGNEEMRRKNSVWRDWKIPNEPLECWDYGLASHLLRGLEQV